MNYFKFRIQYVQVLDLLSYRQQVKVIKAISTYVNTGDLPERLKSKSQMVFNEIKLYIDLDIEAERIRLEHKENGRKGAKKRWRKTPKNSQK